MSRKAYLCLFIKIFIYLLFKVLTLITAPVSIIIQNQLDATFLFVAFAINICSFLTLALIFIPKVSSIFVYQKTPINEIEQIY
jgi:hypothetical protein